MKKFLLASLFVSSSLLLSFQKNPVHLWKSLYDVPRFSAKDRTLLATELYYLMKEQPTNNVAITTLFDDFYARRNQCTHPQCVNALIKAYEESFVASYSQKNLLEKDRCWKTSLLSFYRTVASEHQKIAYGIDAGKELPSAQLIEDILNWRPQPIRVFHVAIQQHNNAFFMQCSITHHI